MGLGAVASSAIARARSAARWTPTSAPAIGRFAWLFTFPVCHAAGEPHQLPTKSLNARTCLTLKQQRHSLVIHTSDHLGRALTDVVVFTRGKDTTLAAPVSVNARQDTPCTVGLLRAAAAPTRAAAGARRADAAAAACASTPASSGCQGHWCRARAAVRAASSHSPSAWRSSCCY